MAVYTVVNKAGQYRDTNAVQDVISYITSPGKVSSDGIVCGAVSLEDAVVAMNHVTKIHHKEFGPRLRHSVLSFSPEEPITPRQVKMVARECVHYYEDDYQIIAAVHEDKEHPHIHFVMNTTSHRTGRKYRGDKADYYAFLSHMKRAAAPYGIRVKTIK